MDLSKATPPDTTDTGASGSFSTRGEQHTSSAVLSGASSWALLPALLFSLLLLQTQFKTVFLNPELAILLDWTSSKPHGFHHVCPSNPGIARPSVFNTDSGGHQIQTCMAASYGQSHLPGQIIINLNTRATTLLHVVDIGKSSLKGVRPELST